MKAVRLPAAACAALALAACSIGKPIPQATTYIIDPPLLAQRQSAAQRPETLGIGEVHVAPAFAGNALVYRIEDVQYKSDPYHALIADPAAMLGNRMAEWLGRGGPFRTVTQPGATQAAPYMLEATFTELYGDFRPGRPPAAVMAVQLVLIDLTGVHSKVVLERTIGSRVDLPDAGPDALVRGYGQALAEILTQFVADLNSGSVK
jgi:uncharacterized lipoprotein YmbA